MRIETKYTQFQATSDIEQYIEKRIGSLSRFLKRYEVDREIVVFLEVARSSKHHRHGDVFYAEATFQLPGKVIRAEHNDPDIHTAIDAIKETLKKELSTYKNKEVTRQKRPKRRS